MSSFAVGPRGGGARSRDHHRRQLDRAQLNCQRLNRSLSRRRDRRLGMSPRGGGGARRGVCSGKRWVGQRFQSGPGARWAGRRFGGHRWLRGCASSVLRSTVTGFFLLDVRRARNLSCGRRAGLSAGQLFWVAPARRRGASDAGRDGIARGYGYLTLTGCDAATTARITLRGPDSVDAHKGPCYPKSSRRSRQAAARSGSVCRAETGRRSRHACFDGGLPPRQARGSAPG